MLHLHTEGRLVTTHIKCSRFEKAFLTWLMIALSMAAGCAATTTASIQATAHAPDSFRFQSSDVTGTLQVTLTPN